LKTVGQDDILNDIMDVYPHTVGRKTICWCGKVLEKGTDAFIAILTPASDNGYWMRHKVICSFDCNIVVSTEQPAEKK